MSDDQPPIRSAEQPSEPPDNSPPVITGPRPANRASYLLQTFLGFISFWLLVFGTVGLVVFGNLPRQQLPHGGWLAAVSVFWIGLGVFLLGWRKKHGRGLVTGLLIGLGLVGLIGLAAGICFAALK